LIFNHILNKREIVYLYLVIINIVKKHILKKI